MADVARYIPPMRLQPGDYVRLHEDHHNHAHPHIRSRVGMIGLVVELYCDCEIAVVAWPDGNFTIDSLLLAKEPDIARIA